MATQKVITVTRSSDLSGETLAEDSPFVKLMLTVDGKVKRVELDLTAGEFSDLEKALAPYFEAVEASVGTATVASSPQASQAMRNWAIETAKAAGGKYLFDGEELETPAPRGRLSAQWVKAYTMAHEQDHASEAAINAAIAAGEESKGK